MITDEELLEIFENADFDFLYAGSPADLRKHVKRAATLAGLRAVIQRVHPAPVPVAERPWEREGWCDAEGRCWCLDPYAASPLKQTCAGWMYRKPEPGGYDTHFLPHWAFPLPGDHSPDAGNMVGQEVR